MYSRLGKANYWQLWACLRDREPCRQNKWQTTPFEAVINLANYQWTNYGTRLDIITGHDTYRPELEPIDEIDKIMRLRPHSPVRVT